MAESYLARIPRLYHYLASVYASLRPLWARLLSYKVERHLDQVALPAVIHRESVVLDLGCGPGSNLARLQRINLPFASYVGFDLSPDMLAACLLPVSGAGGFVLGDAHNLPFADKSFDVVFSTWVFSHLAEPLRVVREAQRLLRPDGRLIVACVTRPANLPGAALRLIGPVFLMNCLLPEEIRIWPGVVELKTFCAGCSVVVSLSKCV
jgi:ubiquinone/menaquinone biosynthesis C-methylase UbiE